MSEAKPDWLSPIEKEWKKFWAIKEWELSWNQMFSEIRKGHEADFLARSGSLKPQLKTEHLGHDYQDKDGEWKCKCSPNRRLSIG